MGRVASCIGQKLTRAAQPATRPELSNPVPRKPFTPIFNDFDRLNGAAV